MSKKIFIILPVIISLLFSFFACQKAQLTEEEQKSFKGCMEPRGLSDEDALKYLRILLKGDSETIRWYGEHEKSGDKIPMVPSDRRSLYQIDICTMVNFISKSRNVKAVITGEKHISRTLPDGKHAVQLLSAKEIKEVEEGYNMIFKIIKHKSEYPGARICAVRVITRYGEFKDDKWHGYKDSVQVLRQTLKDKDPRIRLEAGGVLLSLGEGVSALPVLDEIAKAGIPESKTALDMLFIPERGGMYASDAKLRDERGKDILIKALDYPSDEVKAFAALKLAAGGMEEKRAEAVAIKVLEYLKDRKTRDYKDSEEQMNTRNAGIYAMAVLETVHSTAGIAVLKDLIKENDDSVLRERAKIALINLEQKSR